eukprot:5059615-Amphidinium_carterae.1
MRCIVLAWRCNYASFAPLPLRGAATAQLRHSATWRVSTHGRLSDTYGRMSRGCVTNTGARVVLIDGNMYRVHRLVAFAHLRVPPTPLHCNVLHVDGDRENNTLENLYYAVGTYAARQVSQSPRQYLQRPLLSRLVGSRFWQKHASWQCASEATGVSYETIRRACRLASQLRGAYEFKFAPQTNYTGEVWRPAVDPHTG